MNQNSHGQSIVFCLQITMIMIMIIKIIFTITGTKSYVPVVTLSERDNQKSHQNFLANDLKDQFIGMNIKQTMRMKMRPMIIDIFSNQILFESICYLF